MIEEIRTKLFLAFIIVSLMASNQLYGQTAIQQTEYANIYFRDVYDVFRFICPSKTFDARGVKLEIRCIENNQGESMMKMYFNDKFLSDVGWINPNEVAMGSYAQLAIRNDIYQVTVILHLPDERHKNPYLYFEPLQTSTDRQLATALNRGARINIPTTEGWIRLEPMIEGNKATLSFEPSDLKPTPIIYNLITNSLTTTDKQTNNSTNISQDEGYIFVTNLNSYSQQSLNSKSKTTISIGRVAIASKSESNILFFPCTDATEYIDLGNGAFHKYYPLAQDEVSPEYIPNTTFNKAVRKVSISQQLPASWELGKVYSFKPAFPHEYNKNVKVRALRLSGNNITLVTEASSTENLSGKTLVEITFEDGNAVYFYNGQQVVLENNYSGSEYYTLVVDDKGTTYSQNNKGERRVDTKLSYVYGEYPDLDYFGWISDKEIVIEDFLYLAF